MASRPALRKLHFWGWQAIIVAAAITLPLGITHGQGVRRARVADRHRDRASSGWSSRVNFFWTLAKRREQHLYVALWFYIATIVTVAVLHIVNSLVAAASGSFKSYPIYAGVQDALVQWWYGHNAVAFFLTTPILGIMYYFLPKAAERPVYSLPALDHPLLVAGLHLHLGRAAPPALHRAARLGADARHALLADAVGAVAGAACSTACSRCAAPGTRCTDDPVLKFFVAGVTFYGMATFEGPLLSIKSVNALAHYTDWIIGHVHAGALGWNGFMAAGMFYWLLPRLYRTQLLEHAARRTRTSGSAPSASCSTSSPM